MFLKANALARGVEERQHRYCHQK